MTYASELPDRQQEQDNKIEYGQRKNGDSWGTIAVSFI